MVLEYHHVSTRLAVTQGWVRKMTENDLIRETQLIDDNGPMDQLGVMCSTVKRVIIENHNYCNRRCTFCPNSLSRKVFLSDDLFMKVVRELSSGGFENAFLFGRYHEPLADPIIYDRVAIARHALPKAFLSLNTNGDFLDVDALNRLDISGLDEIKVMQYLPTGRRFTSKDAIARCMRLLSRLHLKGRLAKHIEDVEVRFDVEVAGRMAVSVHSENYFVTGLGADRGGSLQHLSVLSRSSPCFAPYFELNVDYDGSVVPCCNMTSDLSAHKPYIIGNISCDSLTSIFFSERARHIRATVSQPHPSLSPCRHCQYYWPIRLQDSERVVLGGSASNGQPSVERSASNGQPSVEGSASNGRSSISSNVKTYPSGCDSSD